MQADLGRAGDGLGLPALLGALAGIGTGSVDKGDDRQAEAVRGLHQAHGLSVTLWPGHAEISLDPRLGIMALLVADDHDGSILKARQTADHGKIVGEIAISRQRRELGEKLGDVVLAVRAFWMTCDLAFPPRRQVLVEIVKQFRRLGIKCCRLVRDIHLGIRTGQSAQLLGLAFDLGQGFFEIKILRHHRAP